MLVALATVERNGTVTGTSVRHYAHGELELPAQRRRAPVLARGSRSDGSCSNRTRGVGVSLEQRLVAVAIADQVGAALTAPTWRSH